ncbi:uncharacterized protein LOC108032507 [Drosophila biarmipes]|uniref:uncharacterized protein LOC108032507 n=1 Tax=Drosophila biarmipes TaxID=125945 RepID=UPI0021CC9402|nr:uncharacterized protein LOC108032507 [Drosophila biarmipes]
MRLFLTICSLNVLSLITGLPLEEENNCEFLKPVNTDDSWSNMFDNVIESLEEAISRASQSENCASQVEFLQSSLDRAENISAPEEKMEYVVKFIDQQAVHMKKEPERTHSYLGKSVINLFQKTVAKLTQLSRKIISVSETIDEKLSMAIGGKRKYLFGN